MVKMKATWVKIKILSIQCAISIHLKVHVFCEYIFWPIFETEKLQASISIEFDTTTEGPGDSQAYQWLVSKILCVIDMIMITMKTTTGI